MQDTVIIGIAGPSASGKTLLAQTIVKELGSRHVTFLAADSYYKPFSEFSFEERRTINYDHPASIDFDLLSHHLNLLKNGQGIDMPLYDFTNFTRLSATQRIGPHRIVILEGIFLFIDAALRETMNIRIFLDTPLDVCLIRRIRRDIQERGRTMEFSIDQYEKQTRPMYWQFIEPSRKHADVMLPQGGNNRIAIDLIQSKIREILVRENED